MTPISSRTPGRRPEFMTRCMGPAILACALAMPAIAQDSVRQATFIDRDGTEVGTAALTATPSGLLIRLDLGGLPADSWHGFHIHEKGECDAQGGFESAGPHFSVAETRHGYLTGAGTHAGDMPNQYVSSDGTLKSEVLNSFVYLDGGQSDPSGRALILHSGRDDYQSQPAGDSGERIACAVIE